MDAYDEDYDSMFTFLHGRTDCPDANAENNNFPASTLDHTATLNFFLDEFSDVDWNNEDVRLA